MREEPGSGQQTWALHRNEHYTGMSTTQKWALYRNEHYTGMRNDTRRRPDQEVDARHEVSYKGDYSWHALSIVRAGMAGVKPPVRNSRPAKWRSLSTSHIALPVRSKECVRALSSLLSPSHCTASCVLFLWTLFPSFPPFCQVFRFLVHPGSLFSLPFPHVMTARAFVLIVPSSNCTAVTEPMNSTRNTCRTIGGVRVTHVTPSWAEPWICGDTWYHLLCHVTPGRHLAVNSY